MIKPKPKTKAFLVNLTLDQHSKLIVRSNRTGEPITQIIRNLIEKLD
jgi:hypothetical protein